MRYPKCERCGAQLEPDGGTEGLFRTENDADVWCSVLDGKRVLHVPGYVTEMKSLP